MVKEVVPKTVLVPPDGGWGWIICFAFAFNNIVVIPIMQNFGLIVKDKFVAIGLSATDIALIINANSAFGMMMGLFNGSLLKQYGIRKVSVLGGILNSGGLILTSFGNSFAFYFVSYGLIASLGMGLTWSSFGLALNSYFKKRRSLATGIGMTITGIGPVIMPLCISLLLDEYGVQGTILFVAGLSLNTLVAASLLQPLKWHMKKEIVDCEMTTLENKENENGTETLIPKEDGKARSQSKNLDSSLMNTIGSTLSIDHDVDTKSIYGFETPLTTRKLSEASCNESTWHRRRLYNRSASQPEYRAHRSNLSIDSEGSLQSINEEDKQVTEKDKKTNDNSAKIADINENSTDVEDKKETNVCWRYLKAVAYFFDLYLLKDPIYLNLMMGMSLAIFAEINFSLLTPFILNDFGYSTLQTAKIMSVIAIADIIFRFLAPFIADLLRQPPKVMYMGSLCILIACRTTLVFANTFSQALGVAVALGIGKGLRSVFMPILIPAYVPLERLASASGIQMVMNGICILVGGPLLGVIRDVTGSFDKCIFVINAITFTTIIMWTCEYLYLRFIKKSVIIKI